MLGGAISGGLSGVITKALAEGTPSAGRYLVPVEISSTDRGADSCAGGGDADAADRGAGREGARRGVDRLGRGRGHLRGGERAAHGGRAGVRAAGAAAPKGARCAGAGVQSAAARRGHQPERGRGATPRHGRRHRLPPGLRVPAGRRLGWVAGGHPQPGRADGGAGPGNQRRHAHLRRPARPGARAAQRERTVQAAGLDLSSAHAQHLGEGEGRRGPLPGRRGAAHQGPGRARAARCSATATRRPRTCRPL